MTKDLPSSLSANHPDTIPLINPLDVVNAMIHLRTQVAELEQQIQTLQPTFVAACFAINMEKISLEHAIISRRLTPGQWAYSPNIIEQKDLLKHLKQQFHQTHEPISGREIMWAIKLILTPV
jgi:hypothetical protein